MLQCFQRFQCFKTITARSTWKQKMIHPFHHRWLIDVSNPMSKIVQSCNQPDMSSPCECNPWRCKSCFSLFTFSKQVMPLLSHFFLSNPGTLRNKTVKLHHLDSFRENSPRLRQFHLTQLPGIHQELEEANAMPSQRARGSGFFQVQTCCTFQGATGPTSPTL